jgi:hypothetical protein
MTMSSKPNTGQYPPKTKRLSGARYRLTPAMPKGRQCTFKAQKIRANRQAICSRRSTDQPEPGSATAARDEFTVADKQRALLSP